MGELLKPQSTEVFSFTPAQLCSRKVEKGLRSGVVWILIIGAGRFLP